MEEDWLGPAELRVAVQALDADSERRHVVVRFDGPITSAERASLASAGIEVLSYLGENAFFAVLSAEGVDAEAVSQNSALIDVRAVERPWKLHPTFAHGEIPPWSVVWPPDFEGAGEPVVVAAYLVFHRDVPVVPDGMTLARQHGASVRSVLYSVNGLVIELPAAELDSLADEDAVQWIEPPLPAFSEVNDANRELTQAEIVQTDPVYGLDGAGVSVLVYDGGVSSTTHPDLLGRLTPRDDSFTTSHATHVSGTIGGSGLAFSACDENLQTFIEKAGMPFQLLNNGRGVLPDNHPQSMMDAVFTAMMMGL